MYRNTQRMHTKRNLAKDEIWMVNNLQIVAQTLYIFAGSLFTKRTDALPQDLMKSRSSEIGCCDDCIALKFDKHLGSICCRRACQMSERLKKSKPKSNSFETSKDIVVWRPSALWIGDTATWSKYCPYSVNKKVTCWYLARSYRSLCIMRLLHNSLFEIIDRQGKHLTKKYICNEPCACWWHSNVSC